MRREARQPAMADARQARVHRGLEALMPRVRPRPKQTGGRRPFRSGESVTAIESAYYNGSDGEVYLRTGQIFVADDEIVEALPFCFMPTGTPANEVLGWLAEPASVP